MSTGPSMHLPIHASKPADTGPCADGRPRGAGLRRPTQDDVGWPPVLCATPRDARGRLPSCANAGAPVLNIPAVGGRPLAQDAGCLDL